MHSNGEPASTIAAALGVSRATIYRVLTVDAETADQGAGFVVLRKNGGTPLSNSRSSGYKVSRKSPLAWISALESLGTAWVRVCSAWWAILWASVSLVDGSMSSVQAVSDPTHLDAADAFDAGFGGQRASAASTRSRDPNRGRVGVGGTPLRFRSPPRTASAASLSTIVEWGVRLRPSRRGHLAGETLVVGTSGGLEFPQHGRTIVALGDRNVAVMRRLIESQ